MMRAHEAYPDHPDSLHWKSPESLMSAKGSHSTPLALSQREPSPAHLTTVVNCFKESNVVVIVDGVSVKYANDLCFAIACSTESAEQSLQTRAGENRRRT